MTNHPKTLSLTRLLGAFFLLLAAVSCTKIQPRTELFQRSNDPSRSLLLFTSNVQGYVEPCGCTAEPLGGVQRLATVLQDAKNAYGERLLFINGGNLLFEGSEQRKDVDRCQDKARTDLLLAVYKKLGLFGTILGPFDEANGNNWASEALKAHQLTNLDVRQQPKGVLKKLGSTTFGITAFRADSGSELQATRARVGVAIQALAKSGAQIIIVLSQASLSMTRDILFDMPYIDVVIMGQNTGELPASPERLSDSGPIVVSAGMQGQYVGVLEFDGTGAHPLGRIALDNQENERIKRQQLLDTRVSNLKRQISESSASESKDFLGKQLESTQQALQSLKKQTAEPMEPPFVKMRAIALSKSIPSDDAIQKLVTAYNAQIPKLVSTCEDTVACPEAKKGEATYVGAVSCKACHAAAYDFWQKALVQIDKRTVGHAKAWRTLVDAGKDKDRSCVGCHSIGFDQPGGYCKVRDVDFRGNVQCESCHGAGSLHAASGNPKLIQRHVPESTCRSCHKVPHIPTTESFVYEDKLKIILGKGHGESLLIH